MSYRTLAIVGTVLLVLALADLPYGYYRLLRIVICGVSAYGAVIATRMKSQGWMLTLGLITVTFNPLIPIYLDRSVWAVVDLVTAFVLFFSSFSIPGKAEGAGETEDPS